MLIFSFKSPPCGLERSKEMISNKIGHRLDPYIYRAFHSVFGDRGNPNFFTLMGFLATLAASIFIIGDHWSWPG